MEESNNVLDFYFKTNKNKYLIAKKDEERDFSVAEHAVLSCINAVGLYSEIYNNVDLARVIKMIIAKDLSDEDISSLKNKKEFKNLQDDYNNLNYIDAFVARTACVLTSKDLATANSAYPEIRKLYDNYMKLQKTIRQGHIYWGLKSDRKESVLEHIYGTLILCLGLESEYKYYIDYDRVLKMLLLHETEEIVIGDKTLWDISKEKKQEIGKEAVKKVLENLYRYVEFKELIDEFNNNYTHAANYAYICDKLEYDLQVKKYQEMGYYDFNNRPSNVVTNSKEVEKIINDGAESVFDVHYEYDKSKYTSYPAMRKILENTKSRK